MTAALELIVRLGEEDREVVLEVEGIGGIGSPGPKEDYEFLIEHCLEGGSEEKKAETLVDYGYVLMMRSWKSSCADSIFSKHIDEIADSMFGKSKGTGMRIQETLVSWNPVREYDGLILGWRHGRFYSVGYRTLFNILAREIRNPIQYARTGTVTRGLSLGDAWHLRSAQKEFLRYEKALDREMTGILRYEIATKDVPETLRDFEVSFSCAFKKAVDKLGGIERFKEEREKLYGAHRQAGENFPSYGQVVAHQIAHFRNITAKKVKLYESASKMPETAGSQK